jgi:hypothetical protein
MGTTCANLLVMLDLKEYLGIYMPKKRDLKKEAAV